MTLPDHVARFVAMKQRLGYQFTTNARILSSFARFAADREEACIRSETVLEWAATAASQPRIVRKLHTVHAFACWMHAEDSRHEVPPRHAFGRLSYRRPQPHQVSVRDIRRLLEAALGMPPAGSITPLTWHGLFGLMASTGLRISEALALQLSDVTRDGLVIRETKFRKSRMVALHSTVRDALDRYLAARRTQRTPAGHLFVLATGRPPSSRRATAAFRKLAEQTGLRAPGGARADTPLAEARLRRPIPRNPGARRRPQPPHAGARHLSGPCECLRNLLVPAGNACPAARHCRGRRTGPQERSFP